MKFHELHIQIANDNRRPIITLARRIIMIAIESRDSRLSV